MQPRAVPIFGLPPRAHRHRWKAQRSSILWCFLPLFLLSFSFSFHSYSDETNNQNQAKPVIAHSSKKDLQLAQSSTQHSTLQIPFETNIFERDSNILAAIHYELVKRHTGKVKLNTVGRGWHGNIAYRPGLTFQDVVEVIKISSNIDGEVLRESGLLDPVEVFDWRNVRIKQLGLNSKFHALMANDEFTLRLRQYIRLLKTYYPVIYDTHAEYLKGVSEMAGLGHLSLYQWGGETGYQLSPEQEANMLNDTVDLIKGLVQKHIQQNGNPPSIIFNPLKHPIELTTPPKSIVTRGTPILTMLFTENGIDISPVTRWEVEVAPGRSKLLEFHTDDLLNDRVKAQPRDYLNPGAPTPIFKKAPAVEWDQIEKELSPRLSRLLEENEIKKAGSLLPARVGQKGETSFYSPHLMHHQLAPHKAIDVLDLLKHVGLESNHKVSVGDVLYASAVRADIKNKGDDDLSMPVMAHVSHAETQEQAELLTARYFVQEIIGPIKKRIKEKTIGLIEARMASEAAVGIGEGDIVDRLQNNFYLSTKDIVHGYYTDHAGNRHSLEELVLTGDFLKLKLELYLPEGRQEISLQYQLGYEWDGRVHYLLRNGIKGVPPVMRTAVYSGADSYAVAALLQKPYQLVLTQRASTLLAGAARDLVDGAYKHSKKNLIPLWNSKFLKKVYNTLMFFQQSGLRLHEVFLRETVTLYEAKFGQETPIKSIKHLNHVIRKAINRDELKPVNALRRIVNDVNEYNERGTQLEKKMWSTRKGEFIELLPEVYDIFDQNREFFNDDFVTEFEQSHQDFANHIRRLSKRKAKKAISRLQASHNGRMLGRYERALLLLEGQLTTNGRKNLTNEITQFIEVMVENAVPIIYRYYRSREQIDGYKAKTLLKMMGVDPSESNLKMLERLATSGAPITKQELMQLRGVSSVSDCEGLLLNDKAPNLVQ